MSVPPARVTFDSQAFTYLVNATSGLYDPTADPDRAVGEQSLAALRVFLHHPVIIVLPTVMAEVKAIGDAEKREAHLMFHRVHLVEFHLDREKVDALARYYQRSHPGARRFQDCQVVAEAELARIDFLLTFDPELIRHLDRRTGFVKLRTPAEFWQFMSVPPGSQPKWEPHSTNPLSQATWWRW